METIILVGVAVIALLLWEIKKAIDKPQSLKESEEKYRKLREYDEWIERRANDWQKRHPDALLADLFHAAERYWPTAEEEKREAELGRLDEALQRRYENYARSLGVVPNADKRRIEEENAQLSTPIIR
jgi:biopolymer transport protein ExbB/TolQ